MRDEISPISSLRAWNALIECLGQKLHLTPEASVTLSRGNLERHTDEDVYTEITTAYGTIWAKFETLPIGPLTQTKIDEEVLKQLPRPLYEAVRSLAVAKLRRVLSEDQSRAVLSVRSNPVKLPSALALENLYAVIEGPWEEPVSILLSAEWPVLAALTRLLQKDDNEVLPNALAQHIPTTINHILIGRTLTMDTVVSLAAGDILLLDQGKEVVVGENYVFSIGPKDAGYILQDLKMSDEPAIEETLPALSADAEEPLQSVGEIPVKMSFVLGEHVVTLAELQSMKVGSMVPLALAHPTLAASVRVLANGKLIGHGNIVEVDGVTGVRFSKLFGQARMATK